MFLPSFEAAHVSIKLYPNLNRDTGANLNRDTGANLNRDTGANLKGGTYSRPSADS